MVQELFGIFSVIHGVFLEVFHSSVETGPQKFPLHFQNSSIVFLLHPVLIEGNRAVFEVDVNSLESAIFLRSSPNSGKTLTIISLRSLLYGYNRYKVNS